MPDVQHYGGVYRGIAHDIRDPLGQKRIKVRVPQLFGQDVTEWAWPVQFSSVDVQLPEVGQGVWVAFESGEPGFPVWLGTFSTKGISPKKVLINNPSSAQLTEDFIVSSGNNLSLVATLVTMSQKLENLQTQITSLAGRVTTLESQIP